MKKLIIITTLTLLSITILSSCQSHGSKCPGMYSSNDNLQNTAVSTEIID